MTLTTRDLIAIDIGGTSIMARVTKAATRELGLVRGLTGLGFGEDRFFEARTSI